MNRSKITNLEIVSGNHPIPVKVGTPVYLGNEYPRIPMITGRCGHIISIDGNQCKMYSDGFRGTSLDFINASDEAEKNDPVVAIKLYNNRALYAMDEITTNELIAGGF